MKKKLLIVLSVLMLACCSLFGMTVSASAETVVKTPGSLEITSNYSATHAFMFYKNPVKGAVTIEFDYKPNAWNAQWGFGLVSSTLVGAYSSKIFLAQNYDGIGNAIWTPWAGGYLSEQVTWQNYNEGYGGAYNIFQKVRIKLEVNADGDADIYVKSIEDSASYAGSNPQQTEYVKVMDTVKGIYADEVKQENGCYIAFNFVNGASPAYFYGFTATDTVNTYTDDQTAENLSDNYILTSPVNDAITNGSLVYSPAVTEEVLGDTEGALVFTPSAGNDGMINHKVQVSGAMDIYVDIDLGGINFYGFGLMKDGGNTSPYNSNDNLIMINKSQLWAPWGAKAGAIASATAFNNGYQIKGRTTIRMNVTADGDVTLYDGDVQLYNTLEGLYESEVKGSYFCMFVRAGSDNGYVYSVKINDENGVKLDRINFAYDILNADNFVFTQSIKDGLGTIVYRQYATGIYAPGETATLNVSGVETVTNEGESIDLTPVVNNKAETDVLTVKVNGEVVTDYNHKFTEAGTYTVTYFLTDKDGKDLDSASVKVTVNALIAMFDVSAVKTEYATGDCGDLTPVIINKKDTDVVTVKVNGEVVTDYNYTFAAAGEYTVEYLVVNANGEELDKETVTVNVVDTEGALVFNVGYAQDGMVNNKVKIFGAMDIYIDFDMTTFNNFGFGLMDTYGDTSPYNSALLFANATGIYTPWATAYIGTPTAYLNDYVFTGRTVLRVNITSDGSVTLYVGEVKILDTIPGIYENEVANGGYFCMFARVGETKGYVYNVRINDANGNRLNKLDFNFDILSTENFHFTTSVQNGLGNILYWQKPTGAFITLPTAELSVGNIATSVNEGKQTNLTPVITNMAEGDVLTVTVDGTVITDYNHVFTTTGYRTVVYEVKNGNGELLDKATVKVFVKANSTQNNAETNFNQGYFDGREFEATSGVAVKDNALYVNTQETAIFTTKGYSESFILTFDITSYVRGEIKVVFGVIDGNEYAFTFLADGKVKFGDAEYDIGKDIYGILSDGNSVTVRINVFGGKATLYVRASNESVENIDVELITVSDILLVGKTGFGGVNAEFTADNVKFISLTSVEEDNTYYPSDEELNPDLGNDDEKDSVNSSSTEEKQSNKNSCKGSISVGAELSVLMLGLIVFLKKRKQA